MLKTGGGYTLKQRLLCLKLTCIAPALQLQQNATCLNTKEWSKDSFKNFHVFNLLFTSWIHQIKWWFLWRFKFCWHFLCVKGISHESYAPLEHIYRLTAQVWYNRNWQKKYTQIKHLGNSWAQICIYNVYTTLRHCDAFSVLHNIHTRLKILSTHTHHHHLHWTNHKLQSLRNRKEENSTQKEESVNGTTKFSVQTAKISYENMHTQTKYSLILRGTPKFHPQGILLRSWFCHLLYMSIPQPTP